jgi:hypothetical protein
VSTDRQSAANKRPPRKTPAERSEEFDAEQRRLKQEAMERMKASKKSEGSKPKKG